MKKKFMFLIVVLLLVGIVTAGIINLKSVEGQREMPKEYRDYLLNKTNSTKISPSIIISSSENHYIWNATQEGLRTMKGQIEKRYCPEINQTNSETCITWNDYNESEVNKIITDIVYSRLEGEAEEGLENKDYTKWGEGNLTITEKK